MLERGQWAPTEVAHIRRQIHDHQQQLLAGVANPTAGVWTGILNRELDPLLRMRLDFKLGFVLDRWVSDWNCWAVVGTLGWSRIRPDLVDYLKSRDMQRYGAEKYLAMKRKQAAKVCEANERKSTEKVLAAVDSLSSKQVENFVRVEQARHTGEKLVHHGPDLRFVEHVAEAQKTTPAIPDDMGQYCGNPGMNPKVYTRKKGGKHIHG